MAIRLRRDAQRWVYDRILQETSKVFHFQGHGHGPLPRSVHQHDMISKHLGRVAFRVLAVAEREQAAGHDTTALELYFDAATLFAQAQHVIFENNDEKRLLHGLSIHSFDHVRELAPTPLERVEIPWGDRQVYGNLHLLPDRRPAPCVILIPGCDMTKESYPHPLHNHARQRGMHILTMDGPGQGECNLDGTRLTPDNYESAVSAVVDYLETRDEIIDDQIALLGISFGSYWSFRAAAADNRLAAHVAFWASICDKHYLMNVESPRYKRLFAYLMQAESEDELDELITRMSTEELGPRIEVPSLLTIGESDPRSPLRDVEAIYDSMTCERELWVFEDQHHMGSVSGHAVFADRTMWELDGYWSSLDWIRDRLDGRPVEHSGATKWLPAGGAGPYADEPVLAQSWLEARG